MAKQIIQLVKMNTPLSQAQRDFVDHVRANPSMPEFVELYLEGII